MKESSAASFERLEKLSASELNRSAERLVAAENRHVASLIAHLSEISRRKVHLDLRYENLFDYCVTHLRLSEGSAYLRIQVANICRRFPQILDHLAENKITLTVAGLLCPHLREDNVEKLLSDSEGKTKRQVAEYLVALEPKPIVEPMIRKKPAPKGPEPAGQAALSERGGERAEAPAPASPLLAEAGTRRGSGAEGRGKLEPAQPDVYNFRFSAPRAFKEKLERLGEVLGIQATEKRMAEVLERALEVALDQKDPQRRLERRRKREERARVEESSPADVNATKTQAKRSRHVPVARQDRVLERASYQCEYRGPDGARCTQRAGLEIDHKRPFAKGGSHDEENLRVFCKSHNVLEAERVYGTEFVRRKIKNKQARGP
jgi:5-methylcytosine-specific restriction endonuclease McrA